MQLQFYILELPAFDELGCLTQLYRDPPVPLDTIRVTGSSYACTLHGWVLIRLVTSSVHPSMKTYVFDELVHTQMPFIGNGITVIAGFGHLPVAAVLNCVGCRGRWRVQEVRVGRSQYAESKDGLEKRGLHDVLMIVFESERI
jgi:hypothetical protein